MSLLQAALSSSQASVASRERLNRAVQILSPIATAEVPAQPSAEPAAQAAAPERAQSSNGAESENTNGAVAAGKDTAAPEATSTEEHLLKLPPAMDILDRCSAPPFLDSAAGQNGHTTAPAWLLAEARLEAKRQILQAAEAVWN